MNRKNDIAEDRQVRVLVGLRAEQRRALKVLARQRGTSVSGLVREGVDLLLQESERQNGWGRLWEAVGSCHEPDSAGNVAIEHDRYLAMIYGA